VKQQADQQELLELQCWDAEKLSKWELERAALSAQHAREQAAADKKVASVLMEAQLLQQQEVEQLTRRFQVGHKYAVLCCALLLTDACDSNTAHDARVLSASIEDLTLYLAVRI
jgi:hypothetical protein